MREDKKEVVTVSEFPLKWLRRLLKLKQVDMATILGIKKSYASRLERQEYTRLDKLKLVAEHHGASLSLLVKINGQSHELEL